ncbi:MAG: nickel-responsive transcriptional regulator NikR [Aquitalea sp.]|nr:nickel-responsive transcriptional regulator NikR [Aquitalea sp.]
MQRVTISLSDELAQAFDELMARRGYSSRSEAVRDLLRRELGEDNLAGESGGPCVAVLSYVFDHHERQLSSRLTGLQHDHHDLAVATMHAHISHDDCIETVILRGDSVEVERFARSVIAETGVRHGHVQLIPAAPATPSPMMYRKQSR